MEEKDTMLKVVRAKVNDKDHEILYKSPGAHRGSRGRTYDFIAVKTKGEAARLIAEGWSVSEEEAHELADALKDGKKGKKRLVRKEADEEEEDEPETSEQDAEEDSDEDPILAAPRKKPKKKAKK